MMYKYACIFTVRTICLLLMACKYSDLNMDTSNDERINVMIRLFLDLPTLLFICVFSAFSYYLSRLNMEVETILHQMDDVALANQSLHRSGRSSTAGQLLPQDQMANELHLQFKGDQIRENTTGFAKMFFIIANILLLIFYIVCFAKCKYLLSSC